MGWPGILPGSDPHTIVPQRQVRLQDWELQGLTFVYWADWQNRSLRSPMSIYQRFYTFFIHIKWIRLWTKFQEAKINVLFFFSLKYIFCCNCGNIIRVLTTFSAIRHFFLILEHWYKISQRILPEADRSHNAIYQTPALLIQRGVGHGIVARAIQQYN